MKRTVLLIATTLLFVGCVSSQTRSRKVDRVEETAVTTNTAVKQSDLNEVPNRVQKTIEENLVGEIGEAKEGVGRLGMLVLTPQQLAQANEMLAVFEGKPLNELIQVYGVMQMAAVSVSPEDRPVFEFVLAKLGVYIAELEQ